MAQNDSQPSGNSEHSSRSSEEEEDEEEEEEQNLATENKSIAIKQLEKRRLPRSY